MALRKDPWWYQPQLGQDSWIDSRCIYVGIVNSHELLALDDELDPEAKAVCEALVFNTLEDATDEGSYRRDKNEGGIQA